MLFGSIHNASTGHCLLNRNADRLGVIFDAMGGMILLRQEGTFAGWNATAQTISRLGSSRNSTGRKSFALVPDDFGLVGAARPISSCWRRIEATVPTKSRARRPPGNSVRVGSKKESALQKDDADLRPRSGPESASEPTF